MSAAPPEVIVTDRGVLHLRFQGFLPVNPATGQPVYDTWGRVDREMIEAPDIILPFIYDLDYTPPLAQGGIVSDEMLVRVSEGHEWCFPIPASPNEIDARFSSSQSQSHVVE